MSLPPEPNPYASPRMPSAYMNNCIAAAWSLVVASGGSLACAWCISRYGEFGALSLVGCGYLAGFVSRKITRVSSKVAGLCQVLAVVVAFFFAYTAWIHWNTVQGEASWWVALSFWPAFIRDYELSALIGAVLAGCGAWGAYSYAAGTGPHSSQPNVDITVT